MENLILIGMPSSGKSTVGKSLSQKLGYGFIDADKIIEGEEGQPLSQIIARVGVEEFIAIEERVNKGLSCTSCVIATGGSVVYGAGAMAHLKELGTVVYLKIAKSEVERRIPSFVARGVVMRGNISSLGELYEERVPLYEEYADVTIDCNGQTAEETVSAVLRAVRGEI